LKSKLKFKFSATKVMFFRETFLGPKARVPILSWARLRFISGSLRKEWFYIGNAAKEVPQCCKQKKTTIQYCLEISMGLPIVVLGGGCDGASRPVHAQG
jgi:hypothetical protein